MKTIKEYMEVEYPIQLTPIVEDGDHYWRAWYPDLSGCEAFGDNPEEALQRAEEARFAWIESAVEEDCPVPPPTAERSGRLLIRIPPDLHEQLAAQANNREVSLNTHIIYLLSQNTLDYESRRLFETIDRKLNSLFSTKQVPACPYQEDEWLGGDVESGQLVRMITVARGQTFGS